MDVGVSVGQTHGVGDGPIVGMATVENAGTVGSGIDENAAVLVGADAMQCPQAARQLKSRLDADHWSDGHSREGAKAVGVD